jgi:hypothetical protein
MQNPGRTKVELAADTTQAVAVAVLVAVLILPTNIPWSFVALVVAFAAAMLANRHTSAEKRISRLFHRRRLSPLRGTEAPAQNDPKSPERSGASEA